MALLFGLFSAQAPAQTFLIDFGAAANTTEHAAAPDDPVNYWNNVPESIGGSATGQLLNMVTAQNTATTVNLVMVSRFNASNGNGTTGSTLYPSEATRDSLFGNTETFNGIVNIFPSFRITGLDAQSVYSFSFYGSRTGVADNRETVYTVGGASTNTASLNCANNTNNVAIVAGVSPDASGAVTISLAPGANNNNGNHFTYLGVLKIEGVSLQPLNFVQQPADTTVVEFRPASFTAVLTGTPPYFVQWLSNGTVIPDATQLTYTIPSTRLDMDGSVFRVSVSNLNASLLSTNALLHVVADTNPPVALSAVSLDGHTIEIKFNETVNADSAQEPLSYSVAGSQVTGAALLADGKTVVLTLETAISGSFSVTIDSIVDLANNAIVPVTLSGVVPDRESQAILVDFGGANTTEHAPSPDDPDLTWNNLTATIATVPGSQLTALVTTQNLATPINLVIASRFNGANENGTTTNGGLFPIDATRDSLFGNTELFSGLQDIFPSFTLNGLNPGRSYTLLFYASRTGVADNRETGYTVNGANSGFAALDVANNLTNFALVSGIQPTAGGEITVSLAPTANNNNANHFTYLGVLEIIPAPLQPNFRFLAPVVSGGQIHLQWTGSGTLEWAPTVTGPWTGVATTGSSYSEPVDTGTNRFFRLHAP